MNSRTPVKSLSNTWTVYGVAVLVSVLLSGWLSLHENVINPDGICYLQSAADIKAAGIKTAAQLCDQAKWPFYSYLIYTVVKLTHASYVAAAFSLDAVLSAGSIVAFIYLVGLLGGGLRTRIWAAAVILFAHEFDSVREYIVRDHGFWAFYLASLILLVQYFRQRKFIYAVAWSLTAMIATLFRIEGALFLLLVPFVAWFDSMHNFKVRLREFVELNLFLGVVCASAILLYALSGNHFVLHLGRVTELQAQLIFGLSTLSQHFQLAASALAQHVLSPYAAKDASLVLFLLLIIWYAYSVVANVSFIYALLVLYAWTRRLLKLDKPSHLAIMSYIAINLVITGAYLAENLFISKRYLIALSLVFMLWVPFALDKLLLDRKQRPILAACVGLLLFMNALTVVIHFGYSKNYIRDAGIWLSENVPQEASLYSNDEQVMFYSQHFGNNIFSEARLNADLAVIAQGQWKHYDYLALRLDKQEQKTAMLKIKELNMAPLTVFANRRGDEVLIYRIVH
jgi:hypothetical protein